MKSDKELKKELKIKAAKDPDSYYATTIIRKEGFHRNNCIKCKINFWSMDKNRKICGDSSCIGEFSVANNKLCKKSLSYIDVWNLFKEHFEKRNYQAITRYPVVARWNPTVDFTIASIAAFQPYVITGEVDPPAKRLVIPQFCLRFGDIDNVGITGSHCTGFVMIGQHQFIEPEEWDQDQAFQDIFDYLTKAIGLDKKELILHEDAWAGGGNFGPCMEFFSAGLELFNQVYMMYEQLPNGKTKELSQKVLDMGLGMERIAGFTQGTANIYEAIFPKTLNKLRKKIHIKSDLDLFSKFSRFAGRLNIDEVEDIDTEWNKIAKELDLNNGTELKELIMPTVAAYAVTEHTRALLVALADGQLPSNSGGGYNLRVILRRSLAFIDQFKWDITLEEIARWHAEELINLFPELNETIEDVVKLLNVEEEKYIESKKNAASILRNIDLKSITTKKLIELYDSNGVTPELIKEFAKNKGITVNVPENFYAKVAELQESKATKKQNQHSKEQLISEEILSKVPETRIKYYDNWNTEEFSAKVLYLDDKRVILDQSYFYPTSGGQEHDKGDINFNEIKELHRIGKHVVHVLFEKPNFKVGDKVTCHVDIERRKQLTQHHSATHIIGAASRTVLGNHINQAGAHKKVKEAHIDITHFSSLSKDEEKAIETEANNLIKKAISINKFFMPRTEAELKFGVRIYQGGVAPGKELRIVEIEGVDVQACGGTHLNNTSEAECVVITSSTKVSDSVLRITFKAGNAAKEFLAGGTSIAEEAALLFGCQVSELSEYANALFKLWKTGKKAAKKGKSFDSELVVDNSISKEGSDVELVDDAAAIFRVQPEHLIKTIQRFQSEIKEFAKKTNLK